MELDWQVLRGQDITPNIPTEDREDDGQASHLAYNRGGRIMKVWVVRAEFGQYTGYFLAGGYVSLGGIYGHDLSSIMKRDKLCPNCRPT